MYGKKVNIEGSESRGRIVPAAVIMLALIISVIWYGVIVHNEQVRAETRVEALRLAELRRKQQEQISDALDLALRYYKQQKYAEASSALETVFDLYRKHAEIRRRQNKILHKSSSEGVSPEQCDGVASFNKDVRKLKIMIETAGTLLDDENHADGVKPVVLPVAALKLLGEFIDASYYRYLSYNLILSLADMDDEAGTYLTTLSLPLPYDLKPVPYAAYAPLTGLAPGSRIAQALQRKWVEKLRLPLEVETRKTGIKLRLIPPGNFVMGSPLSEDERELDEAPHSVILTKAFYCGKFEITQGQWKHVMGDNPSNFVWAGDNAPVEQVSWDECREFLDKLCTLEGVPSGTYRLLTEAQWEYACRAGTATRFCFGNSYSDLHKYGNYCDCSCSADYAWKDEKHNDGADGLAPVGSFKPNAWGLYDMHGNVWEWCNDSYDENYGGIATDPAGSSSGFGRADRGGSWNFSPGYCRSAYRYVHWHSYRCYDLGLRIMRVIPQNKVKK